MVSLEKLDSKELHNIISNSKSTPTSQTYFEKFFPHNNLLLRLVTQDSHLKPFQQKILSNIIYLNSKLFQFGKAKTPLCSFCKNSKEKLTHFFSNCHDVTNMGTKVREFFKNYNNLM